VPFLSIIPLEFPTEPEDVRIDEPVSRAGIMLIIYSALELFSVALRVYVRYFLFPSYGEVEGVISFWKSFTILSIGVDVPVMLALIFLALRSKKLGGLVRNTLIKYSFIPLLCFSFLRLVNSLYTLIKIDLLLEAIRIKLTTPQATFPDYIEKAIEVSYTIDKATTLAAMTAFLMLGYGYYALSISIKPLKKISFPSFLMIMSSFLLFLGFSMIMIDLSALFLGKRLRDSAPELLKKKTEKTQKIIGH